MNVTKTTLLAAGSTIAVDGHLHAPRENHINGKPFPMEAHLVHADKDGNLAVIAVMFTQGKANKALAEAWTKMPRHAGDQHTFSTAMHHPNNRPIQATNARPVLR